MSKRSDSKNIFYIVLVWLQSSCPYLLSFKLFWQFPIKRLQTEILAHQIHAGNNLRILKSDAFGGCVLQCLIHQGQNGLLGLQGHLQGVRPQQEAELKSLGNSFKTKLRTACLSTGHPRADELSSQETELVPSEQVGQGNTSFWLVCTGKTTCLKIGAFYTKR